MWSIVLFVPTNLFINTFRNAAAEDSEEPAFEQSAKILVTEL